MKDEAVLVPPLMVELKLNVLAEVISEVSEEDEAAAVAATCCMCLMSLRVTMVDLGLDRAVMGSTVEVKVVTVSIIESYGRGIIALLVSSPLEVVATRDDIYEVIDEVDE